jgi:hypothetical protein
MREGERERTAKFVVLLFKVSFTTHNASIYKKVDMIGFALCSINVSILLHCGTHNLTIYLAKLLLFELIFIKKSGPFGLR